MFSIIVKMNIKSDRRTGKTGKKEREEGEGGRERWIGEQRARTW